MQPVKTACPISRSEFREHAKPVTVTIDGATMSADPKEFSTQSLGWNISTKATILVNGKPVKCQVGLNITVVGSKELPVAP